ncbi:MAG: alpha/beta fold hydrolase, partial [Aureliella sp.]
NYRSQSLYWCRNPGPEHAGELWESVIIDRPGTSETGRLVDIDGDGELDILPSGTSFAAWYQWQADREDSHPFVRRDLPSELMGHGIGAGDLNGDGRIDIVSPNGWAEAPLDRAQGRWLWHPEFQLADDCGLPILCYDVDQDGDTDLVWGRGHDIGLYWTEQVAEGQSSITLVADAQLAEDGRAETLAQLVPKISQTKWITHAIDTSWSNIHTLMLADVDGDGHDDVVAGKRYMGHDGKDPGENEPLSVHWYAFDTTHRTWQSHLISYAGTCGIDLDSVCVDLDGDDDIDILAPSRAGLHWLENLRIADDATNRMARAREELSGARQAPRDPLHDNFQSLVLNGQTVPLATASDHGLRRQQILRQMEQVMGALPSSAMRAPLEVRVESIEDTEHYWRLKLTYAAETAIAGTADDSPLDRVPAYLLVPHQFAEALPAMLCLHQTDFEFGKGSVCGLGGRATLHYAHELAEAGYVCLAPDYPGFVDYAYDFATDRERYASGTMKAIWNNIRAIDLLESLPCVNRDRIGAIGHSLGGHNALYTAAFDQRIRCVISSCGFNAFADYYGGDLKGWSSERYMPRIASEYGMSAVQMPFDFPEVLAAIAPRPLFINAPLRDDNFAVAGVRKCEAALRPLLDLLGKSTATQFVYPDEQHDFPDAIRAEAYAWLKETL